LNKRRFQLNVSLLKVYNYYRVFVGLALLGMFLQPFAPKRGWGCIHPEAFVGDDLLRGDRLLSAH
jgi:hypothetical protein